MDELLHSAGERQSAPGAQCPKRLDGNRDCDADPVTPYNANIVTFRVLLADYQKLLADRPARVSLGQLLIPFSRRRRPP